ncbi:MAG: histidine--tRNA ligase [Candidatus Saganbacteria bacterium]|nr:histidine--tRNA ligase [Candidatus Saganbacteria bacterium]
MLKYSAPKGTNDIFSPEIELWQKVEQTCRELFSSYNYNEIRTPAFESTELFKRSIGEETDIVGKEMFCFGTEKGKEDLTLRPEATAAVVRAALEHSLIGQEHAAKLFYIGPMFRKERPQAGRYRQFHQAGVEFFGSADPLSEVEVLALAAKLFEKLGLSDVVLEINNLGCPHDQKEYKHKLKEFFKKNLHHLCKDCQRRYETNPLRILDCKIPGCQKYIDEAPGSIDSACEACNTHFNNVIGYLDIYKIKYAINKRLARGLDYYTGLTFEVKSASLGAQNAICGGGRYDNLVAEFGGKATPAVGFAIGIERTIECLKGTQLTTHNSQLGLYIATLGEEARKKGFELLQRVRAKGVSAEMDFIGRSLKAQMREANRLQAQKVWILGENELANGILLEKNMQDSSQVEIPIASI